jgi:hypothetical protein
MRSRFAALGARFHPDCDDPHGSRPYRLATPDIGRKKQAGCPHGRHLDTAIVTEASARDYGQYRNADPAIRE